MSEYNKLLFDQYEVGKTLDKALTNFKKDGPTSDENKNVKTYWTSLNSNHEALRLHVSRVSIVSRYGTESEFAKFSVLRKDFMMRVCEELAKIPSYVISYPDIVNTAKVFGDEMIRDENDSESRAALLVAKGK